MVKYYEILEPHNGGREGYLTHLCQIIVEFSSLLDITLEVNEGVVGLCQLTHDLVTSTQIRLINSTPSPKIFITIRLNGSNQALLFL